MQLKQYQKKALEGARSYLELLSTWRKEVEENAGIETDFAAKAWGAMEGFHSAYHTEYKKALFNTCNDLARETTMSELGMELQGKEVSFAVIHEDEWERRFNELFS